MLRNSRTDPYLFVFDQWPYLIPVAGLHPVNRLLQLLGRLDLVVNVGLERAHLGLLGVDLLRHCVDLFLPFPGGGPGLGQLQLHLA